MGRLIEFIFFSAVAYFVFKYLNKFFSNSSPSNYHKKPYQKQNQNYQSQQKSNKPDQKDIKWDAETVDYEEIETRDNEKK